MNAKIVSRLRHSLTISNLLKWLVAILWFVVTIYPLWWMFSVVFTPAGVPVAINPRLYPTSLTDGIAHIKEVIVGSEFLHSYLVSFAYSGLQIGGMLLVCSMAAYEFSLHDFPGKNTLFIICLSALMVPGVVTLIPTYRIVAKLGWLDTIWGLAVPGIASAFALFLFRQFMENIPRELLDAAQIDGASHFGAFWYVVRPLSSNAYTTMGVLGFMFAWGNFIWPLVISRKAAMYTISLAVTHYIGPQTWYPIEITLTAAFLAALPPIIVYIVLQRYLVEGIALTGLKG
jgi:multiple sugar transport system permease protein